MFTATLHIKLCIVERQVFLKFWNLGHIHTSIENVQTGKTLNSITNNIKSITYACTQKKRTNRDRIKF